MAFQDNSGGIILDATLTDVGRKYMAKGKFRVTKFALGDDEINYALVSGSPSTVDDHKIPTGVMPSVLEAFGGQQSNINYGLISLPRNDLLYIPIFKINTKIDGTASKHTNNFIHVAVNKETGRKLESDLGSPSKILYANKHDKNNIVVESGIEVPSDGGTSGEAITTDLVPTEKNKKAYILNMGLYDRNCLLYADSKLIECVYSSNPNATFENDKNDKLYVDFLPMQKLTKVSLPTITKDHEVYKLQTINHKVLHRNSTATGNSHSEFQGPRASVFAINIDINIELTSNSTGESDRRYKLLGNESIDLFSSGNLYDFIDTTIYVEGLSSNSRLQIPIRIVRFAGTST